MTTAEWITASLVFIIAAILAVVSIRSFQNKGFLFNNAYIYASREERGKMDKKPYYRQSAIVFCILCAVFLVIGLSLLLHKDKLFLLEIPLMLNLTGLNKKNIDDHLHKLMENYNPHGLPYGILVSYVDCDRTRFNEITVSYSDHITEAAPENYVCIGQPRNIPTIGQYLKCIEMAYECGGQYFTIYHILVGMVELMA